MQQTLYKVSTRKEWNGKVAAIVTRFDGFRASYSLHPDRATAYSHGRKVARDLTRQRRRNLEEGAALRDKPRVSTAPEPEPGRRYDRLSRVLAYAVIWLVAASFAAPFVRAAL